MRIWMEHVGNKGKKKKFKALWVQAEPSHWLHEISISKTVRHHIWPGLIPPLWTRGTYFIIPSLRLSYSYLIKFHDFVDNSQEGKHQMKDATQAQMPAPFVKEKIYLILGPQDTRNFPSMLYGTKHGDLISEIYWVLSTLAQGQLVHMHVT